MMTVYYDYQPESVKYCALPNGKADVWLRKDIREETDDEGAKRWVATEHYFRTSMSAAEVSARAAELFDEPSEPEYAPPTERERLDAIEDAVTDMLAMIAEMEG